MALSLQNLSPNPNLQPINPDYVDSQKDHKINWAQVGLEEEKLKEQEKQNTWSNIFNIAKTGLNALSAYTDYQNGVVDRKAKELQTVEQGIKNEAAQLELDDRRVKANEKLQYLAGAQKFIDAGDSQGLSSWIASHPREASENQNESYSMIGWLRTKGGEDMADNVMQIALPQEYERQKEFNISEQNKNYRANLSKNISLAAQQYKQEVKAREEAYKQQTKDITNFNTSFYSTDSLYSSLSNVLSEDMVNSDGTADLTGLLDPDKFTTEFYDLSKVKDLTDSLRLINGQDIASGVSVGVGENAGYYVNSAGAKVNPNTGKELTQQQALLYKAQTEIDNRNISTDGLKLSGLSKKQEKPVSKVVLITNKDTGAQTFLVLDSAQTNTLINAKKAVEARKKILNYTFNSLGLPTKQSNSEYQNVSLNKTVDAKSLSSQVQSTDNVKLGVNPNETLAIDTVKGQVKDINSISNEDDKKKALNKLYSNLKNNPGEQRKFLAQTITETLIKEGVNKNKAATQAISYVSDIAKSNPTKIENLVLAAIEQLLSGDKTKKRLNISVDKDGSFDVGISNNTQIDL